MSALSNKQEQSASTSNERAACPRQSAASRTSSQLMRLSAALLVGCALALATGSSCQARRFSQEPTGERIEYRAPRSSPFAARRAADDSRPLVRLAAAASQQDQVVVGKFKAPAPNQMHRQRVPKSSDSASQTLGASYRVSGAAGDSDSGEPERIVHGIFGASSAPAASHQQQQQQRPTSVQRTVGAKMLVSDEGLNYPPSKLSADIHGNVAEIVTAPPELVDNDFLLPHSNRWNSARP